MKKYFFYLVLILSAIYSSCNNNSNATGQKAEIKREEITTDSHPGAQSNAIVGEWKQQYTYFDKNGNYKLEPEEKKPSDTKLGFKWFQFNADGSCIRDSDLKFKSTYSIQEQNGTKKLLIEGGDNLRYTITELTDKELILGSGGAFIVFK